jgi:hypothetical protein
MCIIHPFIAFFILQGSAIYVSSNGDLTMNTTCIENNKIRTFPGVVFLEQKSNLITANSNFGDNNTGKNLACNGVFQDTPTGRGLCSQFDASSCPLNPPPNITCFTDWRELSETIGQTMDGGIFVICENTILDVSLYPEQQISPIVIDKDNIIIMCGDTGSINNNCTVFDGDFQFRIESGTGIQFLGVTFAQAGKVSITIEQTTRVVKDVEVTILESSFKVKKTLYFWLCAQYFGYLSPIILICCYYSPFFYMGFQICRKMLGIL